MLLYILLFGAAIAVIAGWSWWQTRRASRTWRATQGRVLEADLETSPDTDSRTSRRRHYPRIRYEYRVDGATYRNACWRAGDVFVRRYLSEAEARAVLARYREGQRVTVYYDPDSPDESALERG